MVLFQQKHIQQLVEDLFRCLSEQVLSGGQNKCPLWQITSFQQIDGETVPEAWERLQDYIAACPHHSMAEWLIVQNFYHGLTRRSQEHLDAAVGGAFLSLDVPGAKALVEKITSHHSWTGECQATRSKRVHQVDSFDMLAAKMDLHIKKLESPTMEMAQIADARITCE